MAKKKVNKAKDKSAKKCDSMNTDHDYREPMSAPKQMGNWAAAGKKKTK